MLKEKLMSTYKNDKIIHKMALYSNDILGKQLHPDYKFSFKSILGELYTLGNGMRYINSEELDIKYLSKPLNNKLFRKIVRGKFKDVPNYWGITELLLVDRLMADRELVFSLYKELEIDKFTFVPYIKLKRGIIPTEVINDKLRGYGYVVTDVINKLIISLNIFIKDRNIVDYTKLDKKQFKEFKGIFKTSIFDNIESNSKTTNITYNLVDISNNELRKIYIGG